MPFSPGDLYQKNRLQSEVFYLHGLWNQGPHVSSDAKHFIHRANPNPIPTPFSFPNLNPIPIHFRNHNPISIPIPFPNLNPIPIPNLNPNPNLIHYPCNNHLRPRFSVKNRKGRNHSSRKKKAIVSEKEWPMDPTLDPNKVAAVGWPEPPPKRVSRPPTAELIAAALAARAQRNGVEACKSFFFKDIDEDHEEGDEGDEIEKDATEEEELKEGAFRFFMELFTKDCELRRYYEANHEKGEFLCLVCESSGVKKGRTYGDCTGLVQHCSNVAKTGWRAAHRGLAKSVCRVVGWNFNKLPMLVLDLEETLGQTLARDANQPQEKSQEAPEIHNEVVE